jgi:outer membrane protein assembly factor BamB/orotate phosphoribosyltransferase-like protein
MKKLHTLKEKIASTVFVKNKNEQISTMYDPEAWIFDFRRVLLNGKTTNLISDIFYEKFEGKYPFQLCALEVAGIPLVTSLMTKFFYKGHEDINAFFIRKSRKKDGLMRMIEGEIQDTKKIVLVDDILNSGNSFWRQIEVLEDLGHKVDTVWSILRFRDLDYYKRFHNRGIKIESLFTLDDFTDSLGKHIKNLVTGDKTPPVMPFKVIWGFKSEKPSYNYAVSKSQPIIDDEKIYFGSDNQIFWALDQETGSVVWKYKVGPSVDKKSIFSNPVLFENLVIFGAYDGNIYALNKKTGAREWICLEADYVGSSPAIASDLKMVYVGLEFGLIKKRGGIIALDARTGKKIWCDYSHPAFTHCSPHYIKKHTQVVIGSNDGVVRLYNAKNGKKIWDFTTFGGADYDPIKDGGFGHGDIKESFAYAEKQDYIIFGSIDGFLYILDRKTGHLVHHYKCTFGIWSTPYVYENKVYFTSADKNIRCIDLNTLKIVFEKIPDHTRIFSSPTVINDRLYVGTNAGRLHELSPTTGESLGYFQALERITNSIIYNKKTDTYFLPTYANEIICLKRKTEETTGS